MIHLINPPPPPPLPLQKKNALASPSISLGTAATTLEKLDTMVMQNFGGSSKDVLSAFCASENTGIIHLPTE